MRTILLDLIPYRFDRFLTEQRRRQMLEDHMHSKDSLLGSNLNLIEIERLVRSAVL